MLGLVGVLVAITVAGAWFAGTHDTTGRATTAPVSSPRLPQASPVVNSLTSLSQNMQPCRKGEPAKVCFVKFGQVKVQLEKNSSRKLTRAVVFSDDMKRDAQDFTIAAGFLMLTINPQSSADERGNLFKTLLVTGKNSGTPPKWSGYTWQLAYSNSDAIRIVVERY